MREPVAVQGWRRRARSRPVLLVAVCLFAALELAVWARSRERSAVGFEGRPRETSAVRLDARSGGARSKVAPSPERTVEGGGGSAWDEGSEAAPPPHNCRFWGLVGTGYTEHLIFDHLREGGVANLRMLGENNRDGWGFSSYLNHDQAPLLSGPLVRRGGPPANHPHDPDFDRAVEEIARLKPRAVLGHVRAGSSGHWGIPNPHPFEHEGMTFAHNGTIPTDVLLQMLIQGDPDYLSLYPTDYVNGYIDSELYFMYLLRSSRDNPQLRRAEAWRRAIRALSDRVPDVRLNFVMTDGDTLYALRCSAYDAGDEVRFYPARTKPSPRHQAATYWVAASEIMGSTEDGWGVIPPRTLAVMGPGGTIEFLPIDGSAPLPSTGGGSSGEPALGDPALEGTGYSIPISIHGGARTVRWEIFDAQGRVVHSEGPLYLSEGTSRLWWSGQDRSGRRVPSGIYYCRLSGTGAGQGRRITVVH